MITLAYPGKPHRVSTLFHEGRPGAGRGVGGDNRCCCCCVIVIPTERSALRCFSAWDVWEDDPQPTTSRGRSVIFLARTATRFYPCGLRAPVSPRHRHGIIQEASPTTRGSLVHATSTSPPAQRSMVPTTTTTFGPKPLSGSTPEGRVCLYWETSTQRDIQLHATDRLGVGGPRTVLIPLISAALRMIFVTDAGAIGVWLRLQPRWGQVLCPPVCGCKLSWIRHTEKTNARDSTRSRWSRHPAA